MIQGCKIESIGIKLPERRVSTAEIADRLKIPGPLKLGLLTGIDSRRVCSEGEDSLTHAVDASFDCFRFSRYRPGEVKMVLCCSISKYVNGLNHQFEPPLSFLIKQKIGCPDALSFDVGNACAGMITGIHLANNFISRRIVENCLVVSGEYITSISNNAEKNIDSPKHAEMASLTVGDAGAAVMLDRSRNREEGISISDMVTISRYCDLCTGNQCSSYPGAFMQTQMQKIHEVSIVSAPPLIKSALQKAGLKMSEIHYLIPHQTSKLSIESGAKYFAHCLGEEPRQVIVNLEEFGNTASTTHVIALYKILNENRLKKEDNVMLLSFASGLVIGILIFPLGDLPEKYGNHH